MTTHDDAPKRKAWDGGGWDCFGYHSRKEKACRSCDCESECEEHTANCEAKQ